MIFKNKVGASVAEVMSLVIIIVCGILLLVPHVLKQDNVQSETVILGYERTARKAARDAFNVGADSLGESFPNEEYAVFVVDSKGKRIYAIENGETFASLAKRLKDNKAERIKNSVEKCTLTSEDPWQTRVVKNTTFSINGYNEGEDMKVGKTYNLKGYVLCISVHKDEDGEYQYRQWWQNTKGSGLVRN